MAIVVIGITLIFITWKFRPTRSGAKAIVDDTLTRNAKLYLELEAREKTLEGSVWAKEIEAERREDEFNRLWNSLNSSTNGWDILRQLSFDTILIPTAGQPVSREWGITELNFPDNKTAVSSLSPEDFGLWTRQWQRAGWRLGRTSWHVVDHGSGSAGVSPRSEVAFSGQLERSDPVERATLHGLLSVEWENERQSPGIKRITIRDAQLLIHSGRPQFHLWVDERIPVGRYVFTDPLMAMDLDGDGYSELLAIGANRMWKNQPAPATSTESSGRQFLPQSIGSIPSEPVSASVLTDLNHDGIADLVIAGAAGIYVKWGVSGGIFAEPILAWESPSPLKHAQVITAGDIDGDGNVDLWLGQYKLPYQGGQFPTPYFDANDGHSSYLLRNEGNGKLVDITVQSGLGAKRNRRVYSASFIDLDGDGDLDFVEVSDFAGIDIYLNNGRGVFTDVTGNLGETRHAFGMSHAFGDFNGDGLPDVLMLGMTSPTADRLERLGLERVEPGIIPGRRAAMTLGNRLFVSRSGHPDTGSLAPAQGTLSREFARTGWSWGSAWADFDNDRDLDLFVGVGHETRANVTDYERQFWLHDIYVANSITNPVAEFYFQTAAGRRQAEQASYGGWQDNALLLNCGGTNLAEIAWLAGVTSGSECHNVIADDLDNDGRLDLIMTTFEEWPRRQQRLLIYHNDSPATNHWVGVRFDRWRSAPAGARVVLEDSMGTQTRWIVTGDSYRSQTAPVVHFGLGPALPLSLTVYWPNGRTTKKKHPLVDRWQPMTPDGRDE
jgi:enediyne biosynthesis protein E4